MTTPKAKSERIDLRLTPEMKAQLQHAADLRGCTLTSFVLESARQASESAIRDHEIITLTIAESERLARALLEPPKPMNQALKAAYAWHKEHVEMRE